MFQEGLVLTDLPRCALSRVQKKRVLPMLHQLKYEISLFIRNMDREEFFLFGVAMIVLGAFFLRGSFIKKA